MEDMTDTRANNNLKWSIKIWILTKRIYLMYELTFDGLYWQQVVS